MDSWFKKCASPVNDACILKQCQPWPCSMAWEDVCHLESVPSLQQPPTSSQTTLSMASWKIHHCKPWGYREILLNFLNSLMIITWSSQYYLSISYIIPLSSHCYPSLIPLSSHYHHMIFPFIIPVSQIVPTWKKTRPGLSSVSLCSGFRSVGTGSAQPSSASSSRAAAWSEP
jgi:hypothetical protein